MFSWYNTFVKSIKSKLKYIIPAIIVLVLLIVGVVFLVSGCGNNKKQSVNLVTPDGAPLLSVISFGANGERSGDAFQVGSSTEQELGRATSITTVEDADQLMTYIQKNHPDFAITPVNLAAKLYKQDNPYQMLAVTTWGLNEILSDQNISSLSDLKGHKLYAFAKQGTPGVTLRALLDKEGVKYVDYTDGADLNPDAVNIVNLTTGSDVITALAKDKDAHYAMIPEPAASTYMIKTQQKWNVKLDLQKLWQQDYGEKYPQSVLVGSKSFLDNPANSQYIYKLLVSLDMSSSLAAQNPDSTIQLASSAFASTSLKNKDAISQGYSSGRLDTTIAGTYDATPDYQSTRKLVTDYFSVLQLNVDDGFFANPDFSQK
jgi:NitT/TauT family transport system substrate-binding protein